MRSSFNLLSGLLLIVSLLLMPPAISFAAMAGVSPSPVASSAETHASTPVILVLGDSLSSAYGMAQDKGWVNLLQIRLRNQSFPHRIVNASITGETTQGGASRINRLLKRHKPVIVLIELGGNDGLRGLSIAQMKKGLDQIVTMAITQNARPILIGMQLPPNYGIRYTQQFIQTYSGLAKQHNVALVPFLMKGFATNKDMIQKDGIHPRPEAQPMMLNNVWPVLKDLLDKKTATTD